MSFQPKNFWIPRDASCLNDVEVSCDNSSRTESKRGHSWFLDGNGPELVNNKKQAMEAVGGRPVPGIPHLPLWDNTSGFQSVPGHFSDRPFGQETLRTTVNQVDKNTQSVGSGNTSLGRKVFENQFGNDQSVGLSMSHTIEDPSSFLSFGGIRKVKVNEVRESDNAGSASMGDSYRRGERNAISVSTTYNKSEGNTISVGPSCNGEENPVSTGPSFQETDNNFISVGHNFGKGDGNFIPMPHNNSKSSNSLLSMGQPYDKENENFISTGQSYEKGDINFISLGNSYNKGHDSFVSADATYGKENETMVPMAPTYDEHTDNTTSIGLTYDSNTISFGGFQDELETQPSGGIVSSYGFLTSNKNTRSQTSEESSLKGSNDPIESKMDAKVDDALKFQSTKGNVPKVKEQKTTKAPLNSFPSNVKSLLSTGIFDGIPVKYVNSSQKNLEGIIKGTGYLCSCSDCNHSKALNAYEFERHAGAKTKHPNNHIVFVNGKTIYAVVQELKNTPQGILFDAIENMTGSQINQRNFRVWKASYQAASRELQRIYGKDEVAIPS